MGTFLKDFIYFFFRQRGRVEERKGEKHQCVVAFCTACTRDPACNPGMHPDPDQEPNGQPFGSLFLNTLTSEYTLWLKNLPIFLSMFGEHLSTRTDSGSTAVFTPSSSLAPLGYN